MYVFAGDTQRTHSAGILGHDGNAVADLHAARLGDDGDDAGCLVTEVGVGMAAYETLVLRTHGRRPDLDDDPVLPGLRV
jgi:hypothetical protein